MTTRKPTTAPKTATVPRQPRTADKGDTMQAKLKSPGVGKPNTGLSAKELEAARTAPVPTMVVAPPAPPVSAGLDNSALEALAMRPAVIREGVHDARIDDPDNRYGALSLSAAELTARGNVEHPAKGAKYDELPCMGGGPLEGSTAMVRTDARYYHAPSGDGRWPIALYERIAKGDGSSILIYRGMT